jgi:NAD(P)-dependent dehydrogenase (short-subunit alcohol dehydrogenase family)
VEEEHGRLDLMVDSAWGANFMPEWSKPFWELSAGIWRDTAATINAAWLTSVHAARIMVKQGGGLIVHVTDNLHPDTSAYRGQVLWDLGHEFLNRLVADMGRELKQSKVAVVGLNPGFMRTERVLIHMSTEALKREFRFDLSESPEYVGRAATALAGDPNVVSKTGQLLWAAELATQYGFTDIDGRVIPLFDPNAPLQPYPC